MFSGDRLYAEAQRRIQAAGSLVLIEADDYLLGEDEPLDSWCLGPTPWDPSLIDRERISMLQEAYRKKPGRCRRRSPSAYPAVLISSTVRTGSPSPGGGEQRGGDFDLDGTTRCTPR